MNGWKTYAFSGLAIVISLAELAGIDVVPNIDQSTALNALWAACVAAAMRHGITKSGLSA